MSLHKVTTSIEFNQEGCKMKFQIEVHEESNRVVEIEAETEEQALDIAEKQYESGEIVLDAEDFEDYEIRVI